MATFKAHKVVATLPTILEKDSIYLVRVGDGFDLYVTDNTGLLSYKINGTSTGGTGPSDPAALNWTDYCSRWDDVPALLAHIELPEPGNVYSYILEGAQRYRFVPDTYNPDSDAFYLGFSIVDSSLSGLICKRSDK